MPRSLQIRPSVAVLGVTSLLGASLAVGAVLGLPGTALASPVAASPTTPAAGHQAAALTSPPINSLTISDIPQSPPNPTASPCFTATPSPLPSSWPLGEVVQSTGFEDGAAGWGAASGVTATVTTEQAASGTHSLLVVGLTSSSGGSFNVQAPHIGWFKVTAKVRVKAPGLIAYPRLGSITSATGDVVTGVTRATSGGWSELVAYIRPRSRSTTWCGSPVPSPGVTGVTAGMELTVYQPSCGLPDGSPLGVYVDDVTVTSVDSATSGVVSPSTTPAAPTPAPASGCPSTPSTPSTPPTTCTATYGVVTQWAGGYVASIALTNTLGTAVPNWRLTWTFPDAERVTSLWGAESWHQSGHTVTVAAPSWAPLPAGGTVTVGFLGTGAGTGGPAVPADLAVNGVTCRTSG